LEAGIDTVGFAAGAPNEKPLLVPFVPNPELVAAGAPNPDVVAAGAAGLGAPNANGDEEAAPFVFVAAVVLFIPNPPVPNPLEVAPVPVAVPPNPVDAGLMLAGVAPNENVPAGFGAEGLLPELNENPVEAGFAVVCAPKRLADGAGVGAAGVALVVEPNENPEGLVSVEAGAFAVVPKGEGAGAAVADPNPFAAGVAPNGDAVVFVAVAATGAVGLGAVEGAPNAKGDGLGGAVEAGAELPNNVVGVAGTGAGAGAAVVVEVGTANGEGAGALMLVEVAGAAGVRKSDGVAVFVSVAAGTEVAGKTGLGGSSFFGAPNEKMFNAGAVVVGAAGLGAGVNPKGESLPSTAGAGAGGPETEEPGVGAITLIAGAAGAGVDGAGIDTEGVRVIEGAAANAGAGLGGALDAASAALRSLNILRA
jgi:hypothetical protein